MDDLTAVWRQDIYIILNLFDLLGSRRAIALYVILESKTYLLGTLSILQVTRNDNEHGLLNDKLGLF